MKKHRHEALIKEWIDNGLPKVECALGEIWLNVVNPSWHEDSEYRLVYPPKPKKQIKILCWYKEGYGLNWVGEESSINYNDMAWTRVPAEDKIIDIEVE